MRASFEGSWLRNEHQPNTLTLIGTHLFHTKPKRVVVLGCAQRSFLADLTVKHFVGSAFQFQTSGLEPRTKPKSRLRQFIRSITSCSVEGSRCQSHCIKGPLAPIFIRSLT
ncbi:hypothetical protein HanRHA438_Chr14g0669221 [Helianthus annuus]|nr:hypothetical protein HanRHA438_Chr14g0669221 [Helianthus annuus]